MKQSRYEIVYFPVLYGTFLVLYIYIYTVYNSISLLSAAMTNDIQAG